MQLEIFQEIKKIASECGLNANQNKIIEFTKLLTSYIIFKITNLQIIIKYIINLYMKKIKMSCY
jgi:hypothetical protein